ncbi:MAG: sigma-70 family RNA polymerase sigma factor [Bacteroidales bacterium]|jgi:RNA polymerase sigma-70 factor (ECF subfamily)|nr:sigma-70 family RNA polymerase sigma factor [Bacteroidales bacterium]
MKDDKSLKDLIQLCKDNDLLAQEKIFNLYKDKLFAISMRYASSKEEAEDMLMESWLKIFSNINSFIIDKNYKDYLFFAWIKKITINNAINYYYKNKKYNTTEVVMDDIMEKDVDIFQKDYAFSQEELMFCIEKLPRYIRIIFNLYAIDQYSNKEIAEILNTTTNSVKTSLYKARKFLQKELIKIKSR